MKICIVSGGTRLRLPSPVNHKVYADIHHLDYRLECGSNGRLKNPYYFKLDVIARLLPDYEWVFWIDDDAFFTDFSTDPREYCRVQPEKAFIVLADGRVRPGEGCTRINSGVILMRNCPEAQTFLRLCLDTEIATVRAWWVPSEHGMFTNSDQDTLLYRLLYAEASDFFVIVPHLNLNARPYHYAKELTEHFICHFPGLPNKVNAIRQFGDRFGVGLTLVPPSLLKEYGYARVIDDDFILQPRRPFMERIKRRLNRFLSPSKRI